MIAKRNPDILKTFAADVSDGIFTRKARVANPAKEVSKHMPFKADLMRDEFAANESPAGFSTIRLSRRGKRRVFYFVKREVDQVCGRGD